MELDDLTRIFEIVFIVAIVAGVLLMRGSVVGVAVASAVAVCVSRYVCATPHGEACATVRLMTDVVEEGATGEGEAQGCPTPTRPATGGATVMTQVARRGAKKRIALPPRMQPPANALASLF